MPNSAPIDAENSSVSGPLLPERARQERAGTSTTSGITLAPVNSTGVGERGLPVAIVHPLHSTFRPDYTTAGHKKGKTQPPAALTTPYIQGRLLASVVKNSSKLDKLERVLVHDRRELRAWLSENHMTSPGIWLITFRKVTGKPRPEIGEIVEELLCFGWIDSRTRKLDDDRTLYLISPRRPGSPWSHKNKQHVQALLDAGLMQPAGLALIEQAKQDGSWTVYDEIEDRVIPDDLAAALAEDEAAARHFQAFGDASQKNILWWIKSAKRPETRRRRIAETVLLAQHNLRANHPEAQAFKRRLSQE